MRLALIIACAMSLAPLAGADPAWTFNYDGRTGVASATSTQDGELATTFTCRAPDGAILITDYTLGRRGKETQAQVQVEDFSLTLPAEFGRGENGERALLISLPQAPPVLSAVHDRAPMSVSANGRTHTLPEGAAPKLQQVAYNCWPRAS
jgi:hypothetical protein